MRTPIVLLSAALFPIFVASAAGDGNRLAYLDEPCDPYYVGRGTPKLITSQWIGEPGVEAVIVLANDDLNDVARHENYLRPILERLKQIDGRAPVSLMTNRVDPDDPQLQKWLAEGLSLEAHTATHPCPCLQGGNLAVAKETYDRSVDLMSALPNNRPVGFRMPCCDSMNSVSPRFFAEIFNKTTPKGNFLAVDSSVFMLFTADDPELPRPVVLHEDGRERFRKYVPTDRVMANLIEDYPYPYVIGRLCWQIPCLMPSDWDAQHLHGVCNEKTVGDLKAAVDAVVAKRGIFSLVFHPHGWIRNDQVIDMIDYAVKKHGKRVKFLTFPEVYDRLTKHVLGGQPLRAANGQDNGVRVLDVNADGFMDAVVANEHARQTRIWTPDAGKWQVGRFPLLLVRVDEQSQRHDAGIRFGVVRPNAQASFLEPHCLAWHFGRGGWTTRNPNPGAPAKYDKPGEAARSSRLHRLIDVDADGICEVIYRTDEGLTLCRWSAERDSFTPQVRLPEGPAGASAQGPDAGLRLVDVDEDGRRDVVFSDPKRYSLHLFTSIEEGWSREIFAGIRGEGDPQHEIPPLVRSDGTNNGAWLKHRHLWLQNEDTGTNLPNHVFARHFTTMLDGDHEPEARAPKAALRSLLPRPGFQVELMAAEPLVMDPIDISWGPDGKAWVVEMTDYPLGLDDNGQIGGRLRVLEDTDGDGTYDKSTVFLEPIGYPSGAMPWRNGVIVTAAPEIFYAEDTDGDGVADARKTLFRGFNEGNQQHRVNHPRWGLDNWIYAANGDSNGVIRSMKTGRETNISGRDLRFRPDEGLVDPQTGCTQYGRNRDDWGNWFGCNNNNPGWHYVLADHYIRRNPHVAAPPGRLDVTSSRDAYPAGRVVTHCYYDQPTPPEGKPGVWTSVAGVMIYRDDLFGPAYTGNLFVDDSVYNVIHRLILTPEGVSFRGRRAADERQLEFLASADPWFRPTTLRTGPDGALWVVDMYRLVIEHPEWIDDGLEKTLDLRKGHEYGRIYRIFPVGKRPRPIPRLDRLDVPGLVAALDSPSGWQRDMAQQMLLWRADESATALLEKLAVESPRPQARLHALCTLDGMGALREEVAARALQDVHPGVRRHAVRVSERLLDDHPELGEAVAKRIDDDDAQVRLQVAYSLGEWNDACAGWALARMAEGQTGDRYVSAAVMSSAAGQVEAMIAQIRKDPHATNTHALLLHKLLKLQDDVAGETGTPNEPIRVRAAKLPDDSENRKRIEAALKKFRAVVDTAGDPQRGKEVFSEATCSTCHKLDDVGTRIGPDIRTLIDRSPENLLVAVVDPNRAFLDRYVEYIAATLDGLQHEGMLLDETSHSILLVDVDGKQRVLLNRDLEELVNTGRSHMPEGLEGKLDVQKMADLFAFVGRAETTRRSLPGNDPRTIRQTADGTLKLPASAAEIYGQGITFETRYGNLGWWSSPEAYAIWPLAVNRGGEFEVWIDYACDDSAAGDGYLLQVAGERLSGKVASTGTWDDYRRLKLGRVKLSPGACRLGFRSDGPISSALIDLRTIELVPVP